jgi:AAA+ ATPase superfamily predicted ATPase
VRDKINYSFSVHTSFTWEKICKQVLNELSSPEAMGRWWDGEDEVDIVAVKGDTLILGECKWTREAANSRVFLNLAGKAEKVRKVVGRNCNNTEFYIFSRSGFKGLERSEELHLVGLEDLESIDI